MPELPDLVYIAAYLNSAVTGRKIVEVHVKEPIVIRNTLETAFTEALAGKKIVAITINGPFLAFGLSEELELIVNLMLAGRLQHQQLRDKPEGSLCFSFYLDDGSHLNFCDDQKMAKAYLVQRGSYTLVPKYSAQGIDIRLPEFTVELFRQLAAANRRKQVRVFINDHTVLSSIGNAYADEILFEAKIHPKTFVGKLAPRDIDSLFDSIHRVMDWGIEQVARAGRPIHIKVRDHMKVRNRKGEPCPHCGGTIRREGVRGYDVYFCPRCQPATRNLFIKW